MACPSWSMSSAVSGLLGCIKALDQLCERTHGTSYELLYLEVACNASLEVMKPNAAIDFQLSDIRNPWFPSEYPTTSTSLLCWVNKVPGFEVMFQRACLIPTAGWNSRSIQLNHTLFGLHTPMRRCNILGQSGSLIFQLSIWSIEMFSPKQKTCVNNGIYGVSWSELIGMVQKTVHASQALATKGPIVLFKAIWWNIIFHNIRS